MTDGSSRSSQVCLGNYWVGLVCVGLLDLPVARLEVQGGALRPIITLLAVAVGTIPAIVISAFIRDMNTLATTFSKSMHLRW